MNITKQRKAQRSETRGMSRRICQVEPWLYISGAWPVKASRLREHGITCVLNATVELPVLDIDLVEVIPVPIEDKSTTNIYKYFNEISDTLEMVRLNNKTALVHCVSGVSRSAALIIAYLIKYSKMTLRQAFIKLKNCRPCVRPNNGFFSQLIEFEREIIGCSSVQMVRMSEQGIAIPDVCEEEIQMFHNRLWTSVIMDRSNFVNRFRPMEIICS